MLLNIINILYILFYFQFLSFNLTINFSIKLIHNNKNMNSKEIKDPILSRSVMGNKSDFLMFKNETLKDFKDVQKKVNEKYKDLEVEIREKLESYETRINTYENKIIELSKLINTDKTIREKVDILMEFKEKADDKMLTEKIRLDNFRNDLNSNVERIDQILKDSVIYPGVIGGINRYKTFHDLIDYVLTQCSQNLTFREKSILDFKSYKTKLENTISSFNTQVNSIISTTSEYTKTCVNILEEKIKSIFNIYDDRLQDARLENASYAVGLERATEALKKELEKLEIFRKELYEKVENGILEVKNDNTRVVKLFTGYKKNFHIMQHKFTQLSDFIKDIRFRINLKEEVKRREYSHMSDLINFDKKKKPGFYEGIYDINIIKKGFTSQLKDYIEGRIKADELFKKRNEITKSVDKQSETILNNEAMRKKSVSGNINFNNNYGDEMKLNIVDLFKDSLSKRKSLLPEKLKLNYKKEEIKEEDGENYNSSKEINPIFYQTLKEKKINNFLEKDEIIKENKIQDKNKNKDKNDKKDNTIISKKDDLKIQIISKDKANENNNDSSQKISRASIKNVINDLFNVKNIIDNFQTINNESPSKDINDDQNRKNEQIKSNTIIANKGINNSLNNNNIITNANKYKQKNRSLGRPVTALNYKNNNNLIEQTSFKQKNNEIIISNELNNNKGNRLLSYKENKKVGNQEPKTVSVNIYNATMNSLGQFIQTSNFNANNKKKSNSSNQKNNKFLLKQFNVNPSTKTFGETRKEETRTLENMFNNLKNYVPKNDINFNENNYIGTKKMK